MHVAKAQMLIRKPAAEVFEAIVEPSITHHFWFTRSSGRLEAGKRVRWEWEMYGKHTEVEVRLIEPNRRILMVWNGPENASEIDWRFEPRGAVTFVTVENRRLHSADEALESTAGFSLVLAGLKFYLEHGFEPNLVVDHAPHAVVPGWRSPRAA